MSLDEKISELEIVVQILERIKIENQTQNVSISYALIKIDELFQDVGIREPPAKEEQ